MFENIEARVIFIHLQDHYNIIDPMNQNKAANYPLVERLTINSKLLKLTLQ